MNYFNKKMALAGVATWTRALAGTARLAQRRLWRNGARRDAGTAHPDAAQAKVEPSLAAAPAQSAPQLELRILAGIHAGACAPLEAPLRLGPDEDGDIVLRDPEFPNLLVQADNAGWSYQPDTDGTAVCLPLASWTILAGVAFTVMAANAAWPDLSAPPPMPATRAAPAAPGHRWAPLGAALLTACLAMAGYLLWPRPATKAAAGTTRPVAARPAQAQQQTPVASTAGAPMAPANPARMAALRAALGDDGSGLRIIGEADGSQTVVGIVDSDQTRQVIATRLSALDPRPGFEVATDVELRRSATEAEREAAGQLQVEYLGQGHFKLTGGATDEALIRRVQTTLRAEFPRLVAIDGTLQSATGIAEEWTTQLHSAGLAGARAIWTGSDMVIEGRLAEAGMAALQLQIDQFQQRHGSRFPVRLALDGAAPHVVVQAKPAQLPFQIISVVGGPMPYLITSDRDTLMPGGMAHGYRLVSISPGEIVFDGAQRVVINL